MLVSVATFCSSVAFYMNLPVLPLLILHLTRGNGVAWVGPVIGVTFAVAAIVNPIWGSLADKYGRYPMMIRSVVAVGLVYVATIFCTSVHELLVLRVFNGLASGFIPAATALIAVHAPEGRTGTSMSYLSIARNSGSLIGPSVGGVLLSVYGFRTVYAVAAAAGMVTLLTILVIPRRFKAAPPKTEEQAAAQPTSRSWWRMDGAVNLPDVWWILTVSLMVAVAVAAIQTVLPLWLTHLGSQGKALTGIAFTAGGAASLLTALAWGKLTDRVGARKLSGPTLAAGGVLAGSLALVSGLTPTVVAYVLFCLAICEIGTILAVALSEAAGSGNAGVAFGLNNTSIQAGQALGPVLVTSTAAFTGLQRSFAVPAALLLAAGAGTLLLARARTGQQRGH
ncbi:MFS transporter [Streptomyces sp. NBC_01288]|uniref:MFS transporter n=1 Tax=Streptomyces sp. NBC_01288 TaxID=2903814 RepID=UPI002E12B36F|nr:MFS transporter [Streptomyces sp. NBC_01288]